MTGLSSRRQISANALFLLIGQVANRALLFLFLVVVARLEGDEFVGEYAFATTFTSLLLVLVSFGLERTVLRAISRKPETLGKLLSEAFRGQLLIWIVALPFAAILALLLSQNLRLASVIWVLLLWVPASSLNGLITHAFQGLERMDITSYLGIVSASQLLILGSIALLAGGGLMALAAIMIWERFSSALLGLYLLHRQKMLTRPVPAATREIKSFTLLRVSLPFLLLNFMGAMHQHVDVLIMPTFVSFQDVGQYSTAYRIFEALIIVPAAIASASFPEMARSAHTAFSRYQVVAAKSLETSLILAGFLVGFIYLFADPLVRFAFGDGFALAAVLLKVLIWGLFLQSINNTLGRSIIAFDLEWFFIVIVSLALASNLLFNIYFLPKIGVLGAAIATLASFMISTFMHVFVLQKHKKMPHIKKALWAVASFFVAAAIVTILQRSRASAVATAILGCLTYIVCLHQFGLLSWKSFESLTKIWRNSPGSPT